MKTPLSPDTSVSIDQLQAFGVTDPQIRVFGDRAYLYASHDASPQNDRFVMSDWQIWSSNDLVQWRYETTLSPESTYLARSHSGCWATDAIERNGKYFWCYSVVDEKACSHEIGLVVSDSPTGPWTHPVSQAWIPQGIVDGPVYDPGFLQEENGDTFLIFGVWQFYIVRLSDDLLTLAEAPRPIKILNPVGPYGEGKTDDKPFLHRRGDRYYLSWGSYYAIADSPYGPYQYRGCIVDPSRIEDRFLDRTWPNGPTQGRHGSSFSWRGQDYFAYCDMSFSGNRYYRGTWLSYVHYHDNGDIEPIYIDSHAVGRHSIFQPINAANFSSARSVRKITLADGQFAISPISLGAWVCYPNIGPLASLCQTLSLSLRNGPHPIQITVRAGGKLIANIPIAAGANHLESALRQPIPCLPDQTSLQLSFTSRKTHGLVLRDLQLC